VKFLKKEWGSAVGKDGHRKGKSPVGVISQACEGAFVKDNCAVQCQKRQKRERRGHVHRIIGLGVKKS